ncbi:hypothetical protein [Niallia sp. MER 6]|uniref:YobI family P-loop NTPase n=1 Tax=Niallia sp. MER 6 TaxID=2939567 RepID=UPI002041716A|nr:hypothetical protein [Niallia sp. MER 6]MCM3033302.1 hypothetical protein [Niallia sp. MER 6]
MSDDLIKYESLAAKNNLDLESKKTYFRALDEALKLTENKNIAITGGYGAGKSTIIESYFEENADKANRMMRVSIATFQLEQDTNPALHENLLEQQILQQMFYQVNPNQVPNSRFVKISDLTFWYIFRILAFLLSTIAFTYLLISNDWMKSLNEVFIDWVSKGLWSNLLLFLSYVILALVLYVPAIYVTLMIFRKLGVSKFGIANANIEFNPQDGTTVFNSYMDEIIYLFRESKYKYIVFEDLDRFENVKIFERLRSLNTTLNNSAQLKDLDIKFIYALKDDVFTNEDETELTYNRTKFFDFIIPTIKVMHSSNAESLLLKKLKGHIESGNNSYSIEDNQQKLSEQLIEDLALFINDMRTLTNICNEFEVYRNRLEQSSVTYNHLFAFIVYKNIYPNDYSQLIENKGLVYKIFNNKQEIISNLKREIQSLQEKTQIGVGSIITDKEDIAMLFAKKRNLLNVKIYSDSSFIMNTNIYSNASNYNYIGNQVFGNIDLLNSEGQVRIYNSADNLREEFPNVESFTKVNNIDYYNLYKEFDQDIIKRDQVVKDEIKKIEEKIKVIHSKSISRLIKEEGIEIHVDLSEKRLLYFLILNNWLNESYEDYLSVFHEGALSAIDNKFIQLVKIGSNNEMLTEPLKNVRKISQKIRVDDITSIAALNISFVVHLLHTEPNSEKLTKIIRLLYSDIELYFDNLIDLLAGLQKSEINVLFKKAISSDIDVWGKVSNTEDIPIELFDDYVISLLENADIDDLYKLESGLSTLNQTAFLRDDRL